MWETFPILEKKKKKYLKLPISPIWINPEEKVYYIVFIFISFNLEFYMALQICFV